MTPEQRKKINWSINHRKVEFGAINMVPGWRQDMLLIDIPLEELGGLIGLGRPIRHIDNAKDLTLIRLLFIHVLEELKHRPTLRNVMKWLTLSTILFCTKKGSHGGMNLRHKAELILADDWTQFRIGNFPGRVPNVNEVKDANGYLPFIPRGPPKILNELEENERLQKQAMAYMEAGEVGQSWRKWSSEMTAATAAESTAATLGAKCPDSSVEEQEAMEEWRHLMIQHKGEYEILARKIPELLAADLYEKIRSSSNLICPGQDNLPNDILKQLVGGTGGVEGVEVLESLAWFIDQALVHPGLFPRAVIAFYNGAEAIGLIQKPKPEQNPDTAVKTRPVLMGSELGKYADKFISKQPFYMARKKQIFGMVQFGVGTKNGSEKYVNQVRVRHEVKPEWDQSRSDFENAFNQIRRDAVLAGLSEVDLAFIQKSMAELTDTHHAAYFLGMKEGIKLLPVATGKPQGKANSSDDFALATIALFMELHRIASKGEVPQNANQMEVDGDAEPEPPDPPDPPDGDDHAVEVAAAVAAVQHGATIFANAGVSAYCDDASTSAETARVILTLHHILAHGSKIGVKLVIGKQFILLGRESKGGEDAHATPEEGATAAAVLTAAKARRQMYINLGIPRNQVVLHPDDAILGPYEPTEEELAEAAQIQADAMETGEMEGEEPAAA